MHREAGTFIQRAQQTLALLGIETKDWSVVEIGSRDINGKAADFWTNHGTWLATDVAPGPNVDRIGDGVSVLMALQDEYEKVAQDMVKAPAFAYNLAVCAEVFEHTEDWVDILDEMLSTAEYVLVTCASTGREPHSAIDGNRPRVHEWYHNVSPLDMGHSLRAIGATPILLEYNARVHDLYLLCARPKV